MNDTEKRKASAASQAKWARNPLSEPEATLIAIRNGEVDAFLVSDKAGERVFTLRSAEPPFRLMVEEMEEGAATLSQDAIVLYANRRLGELLGVSTNLLRGSCLRDFVVAEDQERFTALLTGSGGRGEVTLRRLDGTLVEASFAVNAFAEEELAAFCAVITDLTEQRRHAAMQASEQAWKAADARKDEFLAVLAHELRNPLAAIGHAAQILKRLGSSEPALEWTAVIERQVGHVARIVEDLLDVSRIATGKLGLRRELVDLSAIVDRVVEVERPRFEEGQRRLSASIPPDRILVDGDPTRLEQIVSNLLENARKFTREKGEVAVRVTRTGDSAELSVRDNGVGIPGEMLERVFDMFAQADRSSVHDSSGLGLGLTLVRRLVERHGGTVRAQSAGRDLGSEFLVSLPVAAGAQSTLPAAGTELAPLGPRRVLVVEDHVDAAEGLAALLRMGEHDVRTAYDAAAALEACETFSPEVVLLDIGLPGMDGYELARHLRRRLGETVVIVALTGFGQDEDRRRSREAGIDEHLLKPLRSEAIDEVLSRRRGLEES
ncbi:MAG: hybrid sensor histidine kinase/response regulator [Acidobacteriota bacterium]|nr:hybrid sensor histidine kinase/response regulator [Acidobacteriota bacterium]